MPTVITQHDATRLRNEGLVSAAEIAAALPNQSGRGHRCRQTVVHWIRTGRLEGVRAPGGYLTSWQAVDRMLAREVEEIGDPPLTTKKMEQNAEKAEAEIAKLRRK